MNTNLMENPQVSLLTFSFHLYLEIHDILPDFEDAENIEGGTTSNPKKKHFHRTHAFTGIKGIHD